MGPPLLLLLMLATAVVPHIAWAQPTSEATPQSNATVSQATVGAGRAVVRTPEDIARDRNIVPRDGTAREVPIHPTIPQDRYLKLKQGSAQSAPDDQNGPARK